MNTKTAAPEGFRHGTLTELADRDFWFYGTDKTPNSDPQHVTSVVRDSKHLQFELYSNGAVVARFGIRKNVWMGPAPKAARTRRPNQPCRCGCGATANGRRGSLYLQGHDARHASAVANRVLAGQTWDEAGFRELTPALQAKAQAMVSNRTPAAA